MSLDINTPKGQITREQELRVIAAFPQLFPGYSYVETPKELTSVNDGIVINTKKNVIVSVCETKCRDATIEQLENWNFEWLITWRKAEECALLANLMRVHFTGILFLVPSNLVLFQHLYDGRDEKWLVKYQRKHTKTQATVNGGTAVRENGFFDMKEAKRFSLNAAA